MTRALTRWQAPGISPASEGATQGHMTTERIDFNLFDGQIILSSTRTGIWAAQTFVRGGRNVRTAGQLPAEASSHTLHAVGLTAALRNISKTRARTLVQTSRVTIFKPRVAVRVIDPTFADALSAKITRQVGPPLRVGRNFLMILAEQVARFSLTFQPDNEHLCEQLRRWSVASLPDVKALALPQMLIPSAVSEVI